MKRFLKTKNWKPFLHINLVTQTALTVFLSTKIVTGSLNFYGMGIWYIFLLPPIELVIAFAYVITANIASYVLGWFLVPTVWEGFVRTFWMGI